MTAEIVLLTRYRAKNEPGVTLPEARLVTGLGMEGDIHQGGDRQLSLLSAETRRWMESQTEKGLCFDNFRENILIEGLALDELAAGSLLSAGDAMLRLSAHSKRCYSECGLFSKGTCRLLSGCAAFALVERGGIVRIGDSVSVIDETRN